jgi:ribosomal protein L40E
MQDPGGVCQSCGGQFGWNAVSCPRCGIRLPAPPVASAPAVTVAQSATCPSCGALASPNAAFCGYCGYGGQKTQPSGAPVPPAGTAYAPAPVAWSPQPPRTSRHGARRKVIAIGAVLVLVVGAVGTALVLRGGGGGGGGGGGDDAMSATIDKLHATPPILQQGSVPAEEPATTPITGHLTLGESKAVAAKTVGTTGGTIEGNGLKIAVPDGALSADTAFTVQEAQITGQDFGALITPITPLYLVDDADAAFAAPVTVTMSATIPPGKVAMGFSYDDATGKITPLIPFAQDATSLTVGATHFSGTFGALVDTSVLPVNEDSGFRPGVDDWQFTNYGSYAALNGHCEGQSVSAIWYYVDRYRRAGDHRLYGVYDNNGASTKTPDFWQDDSRGYRFASTVQNDAYANVFTNRFFANVLQEPNDRYTYEAFRAAIATSSEPQLIYIGTEERPEAHAMIVYRVEADQLFIADPNYPGHLRTIPYDPTTGKLGPYSSGENAADIAANGATSYTRFAYIPWRSDASETRLATLWDQFKAGTIGSSAFPSYKLLVLTGENAQGNENWAPLANGYQTSQATLSIGVDIPSASSRELAVYRGTSSTKITSWGYWVNIDLSPGANAFGIEIWGRPAAGGKWGYVDFVRLTINRGPATSPSPSASRAASASPAPSVSQSPAVSGSWVLDGPPIANQPFSVDPSCYTLAGGLSEGSVTIITASVPGSTCGGGPVHTSVSGTWSPGSMPASITPGQKLPVKLTASVADGGVFGEAIEVSFVVQAGTDAVGTHVVACLGMSDFAGEHCSGASAEQSADLTIDPSWVRSNQLLVEIVVTTHSNHTAAYGYSYHWKK